ncbi:uncharacterized protein ASPGLDRAFT_1047524 [Aspergillus glaucus CBS 516.65]|uniref:Uncharacterized protein n=1 Tax=Aspergillus glaucus CBS 516.65 TaxID=1160497 RepID=A0A1L9V628_ASPGL|nr:hypothetical protein ASPGLDRAFT_1047524 [Aspergillus glaucus CBS 516.65]OJJ79384.1 hypothetical protein ASPGLDRAFT_1047524 [Aspergillus glaucus CBS 516.65]
MERLGNERLKAEISRIWDNVKASEAREVSVSSTESPAQRDGSSSKGAPGRREHDMTVAKKTISRRWGELNASKLWPYVTSYSMAREMRTAANTGISFEKAIQALNRVVLDRLVKPHPGSRLTMALSKADFVAVAKDSERQEVTAEEAQQQGYVFDSNGFLFTLPLSNVKNDGTDGTVTATPVESTERALPVLSKELGTQVTTPETRVKSEVHDGGMNALTPIAGHKRRFSSTFGPTPYFIGYNLGTPSPLRKLPTTKNCTATVLRVNVLEKAMCRSTPPTAGLTERSEGISVKITTKMLKIWKCI